MKVRIGAIEITDISLDELDEIMKRYGNAPPASPESGGDGGSGNGKPPSNPKGGASGHGAANDVVILRKMVDAGVQGMPTADLGVMLGRRGKATRGAAREWSRRMGISSDPAIDAFEESRVGTQRALRIKSSLMDIAKAQLSKRS